MIALGIVVLAKLEEVENQQIKWRDNYVDHYFKTVIQEFLPRGVRWTYDFFYPERAILELTFLKERMALEKKASAQQPREDGNKFEPLPSHDISIMDPLP